MKVEQRKRRRGESAFMEAVRRPVFDWVDPVLKRVVAREIRGGMPSRSTGICWEELLVPIAGMVKKDRRW